MYCTSCGKQIADDAVFCPYCGTPVPQSDVLAELVAAARIGDQDAIGALYEKTYSKVYYTVKSMIKDEDAVFDIVQDTYIKAFAHLDSFQGDTNFLPWVRKIAANTARDWLKKKRPMLFAELNSGGGQDNTPIEELLPDERSGNLPEQVIDQEETKRLIREIIEELPEDQRAAIGMFYYGEMSVKEIAAAMGASESAVKSRLMYGRGKIEKKVRELEKQGTKLYSLSPIPFLLLLFRNQEAYAAEAPDSRILHAILASQPMDAAAAAGAAKGAGTAGTGASGAGGAAGIGAAGNGGTAGAAGAAAGGLGALKIGLIVLAAAAVVGLGAFGVTRIDSGSAEQDSGAVSGTIEDTPAGLSAADSQPTEKSQPTEASQSTEPEAQKPSEESTQPAEPETEEPAEEVSVSYLFSEMPVAVFEVTGLAIGLNEEVYEGNIIDVECGEDMGTAPLVKLDPSKTFTLFCLPGEDDGTISTATIHSPSGSSQWEANTYTSADYVFPEIEGYAGGYPNLLKKGSYNEESYSGCYESLIDPWGSWIRFAEIYHPDAPQEDVIYVIELIIYHDVEDYDEAAEITAELACIFEEIGAINVQEIPVEEALEKFHITVSDEGVD